MKNIKIYTERYHEKLMSRDVVYEWEDDFVDLFDSELSPMPYTRKHPFAALPRRFNIFRSIPYKANKEIKLFVCMNAYLLKYICWVDYNVIPIILDPYERELDEIYILTKKLPIYYMTCLDLCKKMLQKHPDSKVEYIPQCVANKYCTGSMPEKNYDVIQFGRMDPVLHSYMLKYCKKNSTVEYIYREKNETGEYRYISTKGKEIPFPATREQFVELVSRARISLLSTPLMDKSRDFGENVDFFTARWFECPALGCYPIGRYSENEESTIIGINTICANIVSYDEFVREIEKALNVEENILSDKIVKYLSVNSATSRATKIRSDFMQLGLIRDEDVGNK